MLHHVQPIRSGIHVQPDLWCDLEACNYIVIYIVGSLLPLDIVNGHMLIINTKSDYSPLN